VLTVRADLAPSVTPIDLFPDRFRGSDQRLDSVTEPRVEILIKQGLLDGSMARLSLRHPATKAPRQFTVRSYAPHVPRQFALLIYARPTAIIASPDVSINRERLDKSAPSVEKKGLLPLLSLGF